MPRRCHADHRGYSRALPNAARHTAIPGPTLVAVLAAIWYQRGRSVAGRGMRGMATGGKPSDWNVLIGAAVARRRSSVTALTYLRRWTTASQPVLLSCDDGRDYVVKGSQAGRMTVNDQIVARLGLAMGAPVSRVALIDVLPELIAAQPEMSHVRPGLAHGCEFIPDCTEREGLMHWDQGDNHRRFSLLSVLYGWVAANDHQYIYSNAPPNVVYSVDHGHFFPSGPDWSIATLRAAPAPSPDATIVSAGGLTSAELADALSNYLRPA